MQRLESVHGVIVRKSLGAKILLIDDDHQIAAMVRHALEGEGYRVEISTGGMPGLERVRAWQPDVVVLDLNLPDMNGLDVCLQIRAGWPNVRIIVLSVFGQRKDMVQSLRSGAYDHLAKPFDMEELIERIRVGVRYWGADKFGGAGDTCFRSGALVVDFDRAQVTVRGSVVQLAPKEFDVLKYLAQNAELLVTNEVLLRNVWGVGYEDSVDTLRVFIHKIRRKIEEAPSRPRYLLTVKGNGYRLAVLPVEQSVVEKQGSRDATYGRSE